MCANADHPQVLITDDRAFQRYLLLAALSSCAGQPGDGRTWRPVQQGWCQAV